MRSSAPQAASGGSADALVTEVPSAAGMVQELGYVNESPHADKRCDNCLLYTAGSGERGACQLFPQGQVASGGWCLSWAKRLEG